jgi:hypothetical protein
MPRRVERGLYLNLTREDGVEKTVSFLRTPRSRRCRSFEDDVGMVRISAVDAVIDALTQGRPRRR